MWSHPADEDGIIHTAECGCQFVQDDDEVFWVRCDQHANVPEHDSQR